MSVLLRCSVVAVAATALFGGSARAQSLNLRDLLPDLLRTGVTLAPPTTGADHSAHFIAGVDDPDGQFAAVSRLNDEIGRQLSNYPLSSSAGSFSYEFDPSLGVLTRPTQSFGSVYTERPFTVGRGKYNLGLSFAQFSYDEMDGLGLRDGDLELVFLHEDAAGDGRTSPYFEGDFVAAKLFVDLDVNVATLSATYGVADRLDVGLVVPIVDVNLDVTTFAEVLPIATGDDTHIFSNGTSQRTARRGGSANGVGDISLRARWLPGSFGPDDFRAGLTGEVRFPTGDEENLLGTGATQARGSVLFSQPFGRMSLHGLGGISVATDDLPYEVQYALGADWSVDPKLTLAFDVLGRSIAEQSEIDVADENYVYNAATDGSVVLASVDLPTLAVDGEQTSRNELSASIGFKLNVGGTFLLTANGIVPLNDIGLRDKFSTLVGVDYSF
jgi:hypothetical protein